MIVITNQIVWSLFFFLPITYSTIVLTTTLYTLPILEAKSINSFFSKKNKVIIGPCNIVNIFKNHAFIVTLVISY